MNSNWTNNQKAMITKDGNVKRYINSEIVDEFNVGDCADISFPNGYNKGNRVYKGYAPTINGTTVTNFIVKVEEKMNKYSDYSLKKIKNNIIKGDVVGTITASAMQSVNHDNCHLYDNGLRIRKLTPKECYRLMGFSDDDCEKAKSVPTSDTQLYKQAGNSIVVDVLEEIFCMLLDDKGDLYV